MTLDRREECIFFINSGSGLTFDGQSNGIWCTWSTSSKFISWQNPGNLLLSEARMLQKPELLKKSKCLLVCFLFLLSTYMLVLCDGIAKSLFESMQGFIVACN